MDAAELQKELPPHLQVQRLRDVVYALLSSIAAYVTSLQHTCAVHTWSTHCPSSCTQVLASAQAQARALVLNSVQPTTVTHALSREGPFLNASAGCSWPSAP